MKGVLFTVFAGVMMAIGQNEIPLWNGDMPGSATAEAETDRPVKEPNSLHLTNVSKPTLKLFLTGSQEKPAPMVIVCPGGGYHILSYIKEGTEIAEWLNSIGVSAAVLKYRVPDNREGALEDAKQAVRLARENSKAWNIDPDKIGMLGFSAGGHLTATCSNSEVRPNFSVLVYPAYLYKPGSIDLVDEIKVDAETPPAFAVQALDDKKYCRSTLAYAGALNEKGVSCEVHLYAKGGHGFGMRDRGHPVHTQWPKLCETWMREIGILTNAGD